MKKQNIGIGLMGFGVVGGQVARVLTAPMGFRDLEVLQALISATYSTDSSQVGVFQGREGLPGVLI